MTESQIKSITYECFKRACLEGADLRALLAERLDKQQTESAASRCLVSPVCRGCGSPVDADSFAIWTTYWLTMLAPCHARCRDAEMKEEAYECQLIDSDCNDCKFFVRGQANGKSFSGHCAKFDKPTTAHPKFASCHPCFQHRRAPS